MQSSASKSTAWVFVAVLFNVLFLVNILPRFGGLGFVWSLVLLGFAAWIRTGRATRWQLVLWALLVCAHALDNFSGGLGAIAWFIGAVYALHAVWPLFDLSKIKRGYAPYAVVGAVLCLTTLFWTWGEVRVLSPAFMGGLDLSTQSDANGNPYIGNDFNANRYVLPVLHTNWKYTGHALNGSFAASLIALAILGWVLWRDEAKRHSVRLLPVVGSVLLAMWSSTALGNLYLGPKFFFVGALGMAFCSVMALRGQQAGKYDVADVAARVKAESRKRTAPRS